MIEIVEGVHLTANGFKLCFRNNRLLRKKLSLNVALPICMVFSLIEVVAASISNVQLSFSVFKNLYGLIFDFSNFNAAICRNLQIYSGFFPFFSFLHAWIARTSIC